MQIAKRTGPAQSGLEADDVRDFVKLRATKLAVTDGSMSDDPNNHFGNDNSMNLKEMCKRFNYSGSVAGTVNALDEGYTTFRFNCRVGASNTFTTRVEQMFRLFRGTMTFKIIPRVPVTEANPTALRKWRGFVTVLPSWARFTTSTQNYWAGATSDPINTPTIARTYFSDTQVAEFKVPMLINKGAAMVSNGIDFASPDYYATDTTYQTYAIDIAFTIDDAAASELVPVVFDVYTSYSDETAVGVFVGLPLTYIATDNGAALYPDGWPVAGPPPPERPTVAAAKGRSGPLSFFKK